ncbi:MAG: HU family DNA-binding protein [Eubacteriales bacterium]|jgi:DNA-binding protein HU-beta|nr:HU family DNA-binding protein [Clostridiales bacterium]
MNKSQLVDVVAKNTGLKKKDAEAAVSAFAAAVAEALAAGEKVQVAGLGTFEVKTKAARTGRNPKTQEVINIPASKRPAFTAGKTLKEALNK